MKRVFFALGALLLTGSLFAGVNEIVNKSDDIAVSIQVDSPKEKITVDQLPQAVKKALAGDDYKDWTIDTVYLVKGDKEYYQIALKKDTNTKTVNFDKDGNVVM